MECGLRFVSLSDFIDNCPVLRASAAGAVERAPFELEALAVNPELSVDSAMCSGSADSCCFRTYTYRTADMHFLGSRLRPLPYSLKRVLCLELSGFISCLARRGSTINHGMWAACIIPFSPDNNDSQRACTLVTPVARCCRCRSRPDGQDRSEAVSKR